VKEGAAAYKREMKLPDVPVFFTKTPTAVTGPFDDVPRHRGVTEQLDWEAELGVIIGRPGRNIPAADALTYVFGYTVINDLTARDVQQQHTQWFKGKSLDGSCPMGPLLL
jgi:2-keto-4-pentenoate hydratase/2-oxohepta-3-ene-1,7-dioic acid hydratase in catechol pathway